MSKCPICKDATVQTHRPFCSQRCADLDLGRWLNGSYAVPAEAVSLEDADPKDTEPTKH